MKVFIAALGTETNTFAPMPTAMSGFMERHMGREGSRKTPHLFTEALHVWRRRAEERGWDVVESIGAFAQPAGTTVQAVWEELRDTVVGDLSAAGGADIVLIQAHGAMISTDCDDCEGDLMGRLRAIAPGAVLGLALDPHFHLTEQMMDVCDLIVSFKEYPHIDATPRAEELFRLAADTAEGSIRPVMRDFDCHMVGLYMTPKEPVRSFVDSMVAAEGKDGVLSLTLVHGFPWGDMPRVGTRMLAIADGDADKAARVAETFGRRFYEARAQMFPRLPGIDEALDRAMARGDGPVVLADMADNAGGGAPADSTFLLRAVMDRRIKNVASAIYWDPILTRICADAGVGATLDVRLGGKMGPMSGDPVDLTVTVRGHATDMNQRLGEGSMPMGEAVWLEADGIDLVVNDTRTQCFHPDAFEKLGIRLADRKLVLVKSTNHFYAGFKPVAAEIIHVATPGAISPDMAGIPYTRRAPDWWPLVEDPMAG